MERELLLDVFEKFKQDVEKIETVAGWLVMPMAIRSDGLLAANAISCGCVVLLSGYFESYLKESMQAFIQSVNKLEKPFAKLPDEIQYTHFYKGGQILQQTTKNKSANNKKQSENIAVRLASVSNFIGYELVWEAFADMKSNPGPEVIKDAIKNIGVKDAWGKIHQIESHKGQLDIFLKSFVEKRNECAHTGRLPSAPTRSELIEYGENLIAISNAIRKILTDQLAQINKL